MDAKLRKQKGVVRPDVWREDLHPRAATRARTIPLLEKERERLLAELQEVRLLTLPSTIAHSVPQLEDENLQMQNEIVSNVRQFEENEKQSESLLDMLDEVRMPLELRRLCSQSTQVLREWERLPADDMSQWAREMIQQRTMSDPSTIF